MGKSKGKNQNPQKIEEAKMEKILESFLEYFLKAVLKEFTDSFINDDIVGYNFHKKDNILKKYFDTYNSLKEEKLSSENFEFLKKESSKYIDKVMHIRRQLTEIISIEDSLKLSSDALKEKVSNAIATFLEYRGISKCINKDVNKVILKNLSVELVHHQYETLRQNELLDKIGIKYSDIKILEKKIENIEKENIEEEIDAIVRIEIDAIVRIEIDFFKTNKGNKDIIFDKKTEEIIVKTVSERIKKELSNKKENTPIEKIELDHNTVSIIINEIFSEIEIDKLSTLQELTDKFKLRASSKYKNQKTLSNVFSLFSNNIKEVNDLFFNVISQDKEYLKSVLEMENKLCVEKIIDKHCVNKSENNPFDVTIVKKLVYMLSHNSREDLAKNLDALINIRFISEIEKKINNIEGSIDSIYEKISIKILQDDLNINYIYKDFVQKNIKDSIPPNKINDFAKQVFKEKKDIILKKIKDELIKGKNITFHFTSENTEIKNTIQNNKKNDIITKNTEKIIEQVVNKIAQDSKTINALKEVVKKDIINDTMEAIIKNSNNIINEIIPQKKGNSFSHELRKKAFAIVKINTEEELGKKSDDFFIKSNENQLSEFRASVVKDNESRVTKLITEEVEVIKKQVEGKVEDTINEIIQGGALSLVASIKNNIKKELNDGFDKILIEESKGDLSKLINSMIKNNQLQMSSQIKELIKKEVKKIINTKNTEMVDEMMPENKGNESSETLRKEAFNIVKKNTEETLDKKFDQFFIKKQFSEFIDNFVKDNQNKVLDMLKLKLKEKNNSNNNVLKNPTTNNLCESSNNNISITTS